MPLPVEDAAGKVILLTGANRGIGLATAHELSRRGAKVVAGVRHPGAMPAIAGVRVLALDTADACSCREFVAQAESEFGRIDGLINNAGILLDANTPVLELPEAELQRTLDVNLFGPIRLCQLAVPGMQAVAMAASSTCRQASARSRTWAAAIRPTACRSSR